MKEMDVVVCITFNLDLSCLLDNVAIVSFPIKSACIQFTTLLGRSIEIRFEMFVITTAVEIDQLVESLKCGSCVAC